MEEICNVTDDKDSTQQIEKYATQQMETYERSTMQHMDKMQCKR